MEMQKEFLELSKSYMNGLQDIGDGNQESDLAFDIS